MEKKLEYAASRQYFVIAKKVPYTPFPNCEVYNFFDRDSKSWVDEAKPGTLFESKEALTSYRNKNRELCKGGNMRPLWDRIEGM